MSPRSRRRQLFVINRRWSIGLTASVIAVIAGIIGIVALHGMWVYAAFVVAILGAVTALLQTIVRNKAGDEIDESGL
ncbi:hypothetical protein [Aeromicrobium sp. P5_D10]